MKKRARYLWKRLGQNIRNLPQTIKTWPRRFRDWIVSWFRPTPQQKKKRRNRIKKLGHFVLALLLIGVITVTIVGVVLVVYVYTTFDAEEYIPILGEMSVDNRSVIYVQNDQGEWEPYHNLLGGTSVWTDLQDIPLNMQNAVVAIEDERFWDHEGVDWKRTAGAMINLFANRVFNIGSNEYGGSTLTQQLIKVTTQNTDHSIKRKVNEILAASKMEANNYSKEEILEGYLNNVPMTGNLVGVGIGARAYFGKELQELTLAECAVLASITNNPSMYDPYAHPENVRQRQQLVLAKMYELEFITKDEYINALNQELVYKSSTVRQETQDYYVDLVVSDVVNDLVEKYGYTYNYANNMVYYGGLNIYSAEDPELQAKVEAIYKDEANFPAHREKDEEDPQAAFFAVDYTGRVVVTVGGRGEKEGNRVLNRSTDSVRSPGSSMKPLTAYGPAITENLVHYSSPVRDAPIVLPNGKKWPHNYEMKSTPDNGNVLLGVALQKSLNTVAVRLVDKLALDPDTGKRLSYTYAQDVFHLSTLVESKTVNGQTFTDNDLAPLALGALSDGATARDVAAAYAIFGNGGLYNEPYTYYKVTRGDTDQQELLLTRGPDNIRELDAQSAYVMVSLLRRPVEHGTAWNGVGNQWKGWPVYGKTGTSESEKDVYFAGGTAYYAAACWFGYDNNQELVKTQTGYAKSLWSQSMKVLHENLQIKDFTMPEGIEVLEYCTETGQLATPNCTKRDKGVYKSTFKPGPCQKHNSVVPTTTTTVPDPTGSTTGTDSTSGTDTDTTTTTGTGTGTTTTTALPPEPTDPTRPAPAAEPAA
ncbi:MAG: transglycosylase domain-containing protein [Clostridia bacterium]|nr:transglycosylase domain-containing protein [Clostridia bacterium]